MVCSNENKRVMFQEVSAAAKEVAASSKCVVGLYTTPRVV